MSSGGQTTITARPGAREIVSTRTFDAPRELVFRACTDPKLIPQWWGPRALTTAVDKMDVRPGGAWRFINRGPDGKQFAFNGTYREIVPPRRLVYTFEYEALRGHIMVETVILEDEGGKTRMTDTAVFDAVEDRDGMLQSGMKVGTRESHDRLAELLEKLKAR